MKIVSREELMESPKGTIFCEYEPHTVRESLMRFEELCGDNDFFYSVVGPQCLIPSQGNYRITISTTWSRDGLFDPRLRYVVFSDTDLCNIVKQLYGGSISAELEPTLEVTI